MPKTDVRPLPFSMTEVYFIKLTHCTRIMAALAIHDQAKLW